MRIGVTAELSRAEGVPSAQARPRVPSVGWQSNGRHPLPLHKGSQPPRRATESVARSMSSTTSLQSAGSETNEELLQRGIASASRNVPSAYYSPMGPAARGDGPDCRKCGTSRTQFTIRDPSTNPTCIICDFEAAVRAQPDLVVSERMAVELRKRGLQPRTQ